MKKDKKRSPENEKQRKKRTIITVFVILCIIMAVLTVLNSIDYEGAAKKIAELFGKKDEEKDFYLAEPDYEADIFENQYYLTKNSYIRYTAEGVSYYLMDDEDIKKAGSTGKFFTEYFNVLRHGDSEGYNSLFTDRYYKNGGKKYDRFTMQMIYDPAVELINSEIVTEREFNGCIRYNFKVYYKIMLNDGTFRDDMPRDTYVPRYVELIEDTDSGTVLINKIWKVKEK